MRKNLTIYSFVCLAVACFLFVTNDAYGIELPKNSPIILYSDNPRG